MRYKGPKRILSLVFALLFFCALRYNQTSAAGSPLSAEEMALLAEGRIAYARSVKLFAREGDGLFITPPQFSGLPLAAGTIKQNKLEGAAAYLNALRAAAGLLPLAHSPELSVEAQHRAVLYAYAALQYPASDPPQGVDPAFYETATRTKGGEILYDGNIWDSINRALCEALPGESACQNRNRLLDPRYTEIGLGQHLDSKVPSAIQSVHILNGERQSDCALVVWPPKGIMPVEALPKDGVMRWSACFLSTYTVTAETRVRVDCLDSGRSWTFGVSAIGGDYAITVSPQQNTVSFLDQTMALTQGSVYTITLFNIKETASGALHSYQYRTAVQSLAVPYLRGDANTDGVVNAADAAAILRHLVKLKPLSTDGLCNAMLLPNAPVSAVCASKILRWLVKLEPEL